MSVMKKVRMTEDEAKQLAGLAKTFEMSESEVLRRGLAQMRRHQRRIEALDNLLDLCHIGEESYVKFEGEP